MCGSNFITYIVVVVQSLSCVCLFANYCVRPGSSFLHYLLEFAQIHVHWVNDVIQPSHPLSPPIAFNLSQHQSFSNESALCIRWSKCWSFSFSTSLSTEYSRLISFRIYWFDLLAIQGTLKSLLQHHNLKASVLQCSAFFGLPWWLRGSRICQRC